MQKADDVFMDDLVREIAKSRECCRAPSSGHNSALCSPVTWDQPEWKALLNALCPLVLERSCQ